MENDKSKVRWQDGTYDRSRTCDACLTGDCAAPVHTDTYKDIDHNPRTYWDWMEENAPYGGESNFFGEFIVNESFNANPDGLPDYISGRTSGVEEDKQELIDGAYARLSPAQRQVWDLVMREQVSQTEAGRRLGITQQAVEKRLRSAKAAFTNYLREHSNVPAS